MVFKFLYQVIKMFISAVNFTHFGSLKCPLDVQLVSCHLATNPSTQMEEQKKDQNSADIISTSGHIVAGYQFSNLTSISRG